MLEFILTILAWALVAFMFFGVLGFAFCGFAFCMSCLGFHSFDKFAAIFFASNGDDDDFIPFTGGFM